MDSQPCSPVRQPYLTTGPPGYTDRVDSLELIAEPVFVNVYGAQESIPRNRIRQPM